MSNEVEELRQIIRMQQSKIDLLETELDNKSAILAKSMGNLAEAEEQYKRLAERSQPCTETKSKTTISESQILHSQITNQTNRIAELEDELEELKKQKAMLQLRIPTESQKEQKFKTGCFKRTLGQLRAIEDDVLDMHIGYGGLHNTISYQQQELDNWESTGLKLFLRLSKNTGYQGCYPKSPAEQQEVLLMLAQRTCQSDYLKEERSFTRNQQVQEQLENVESRCHRIINQIESRDYQKASHPTDVVYEATRAGRYLNRAKTVHDSSKRRAEKSWRYRENRHIDQNCEDNDCCYHREHNDLGKKVKQLHEITKQIKTDYRQLYQ